tara:strand:- start:2422 stop:3774 length:1353 start_codon:yes stop_codon:yes gene_type:complete
MRVFLLFFVTLFATSCSFDNKTGIWKDASDLIVENDIFNTIQDNEENKRYEDIFTKNKIFNKEIKINDNLIIDLETPGVINSWLEKYATLTNNISNISYNGNRILLSKSKKLSKLTSTKKIIFYNNSLVSHDHKGKIFIYSLNQKKKLFVYDFYKKNFKNFKKEISLTVNKNILYAADNLGYVYALNLNDKSLIWAKNYGIPFRSNIKFINQQIFLSNQDNVIYSINAKTGNKNWQYATSLVFLKTDFKNNIIVDKFNSNLFFLNTNGELYSINYLNQKINWVINFKTNTSAAKTDLFFSQPMALKNNNLIVSTETGILSYDTLTGARNWMFPSDTILKPISTSNYTYIISKNDLLICINNKTGQPIWSRNIYKNLNKNRKSVGKIYDFKIVNSELNIFFENGYLSSFNASNGILIFIKKISKKGINSEVVFIKNNMFFIDKTNKLLKFN